MIPLPTYFGLGKQPLPAEVVGRLTKSDDNVVCSNLYFLGKRTTLTSSEGVRIVALGGQNDPEVTARASKDKYTPFYTMADAKTLKGAKTADILLTADWPTSVRNFSKVAVPYGFSDPPNHQHISELCSAVMPRYHFSSSAFFFEREPFFQGENDTSEVRSITRFISLASYQNPAKQKWLYAFTLSAATSTPPLGTTASPFSSAVLKKRRAPLDSQFTRFSQDDNRHHHKRPRQPPPGPRECFFCLSNPNLAVHLITSIGTDAYLTTAKGPLPTRETFPSLQFPCHMLIIPLSHSPTISTIPDSLCRQSTNAEMKQYRNALHSMLAQKSERQLGAVSWEVSRLGGIHAHWQFLPIPNELIEKGLVEAAFKVEAENLKYPKMVLQEASNADYDVFRLWVWSPAPAVEVEEGSNTLGTERALILPLSPDIRFDLQFGRRVLAKLLGLDNRLDWKDCIQSQEDEVLDAEHFKDAFKEFDFSQKDS